MLLFASTFRLLRQNLLKATVLRAYAVLLIALVCVAYVPFLDNPLVFDDFAVINNARFIDHAFQFWISPRWLAYATLAHTHVLTEGSVMAMRIGNLVLHAATVIAVFVLIRELCLATANSGTNEVDRARAAMTALVAATVFAVHPVAVYGVGYLVQRSIVMSTLFMLLMLIAHLRWLITGRNALWMWAAVWYLLSVFSKEHSVMAPAVALLMSVVIYRPSLSLTLRLIPPFAVYTVIAVLVTLMVKGVLGTAYEPYAFDLGVGLQVDDQKAAHSLSAITQSFFFFKYLFLWIFPNTAWMSIDMREPFARSLLSWPYWITALGFALFPILAVGMALRRGYLGMAGWVLAYPWLMFATELSTVRVHESFVLYRAYLWFPLLGALLALPLSRLNIRVLPIFCLVIVCVLTPLAWNRLHTLSDTVLMWDDAARLLARGDEPGAGRIYYNRANALSAKGRKVEALSDMDRAVKLHPNLAPIYYARARILVDLKHYSQAMQDLDTSLALDSKNPSTYLARGITLRRLGREDEALKDIQRSCDLKDVIACYVLQRPATSFKSEKPL